MSDKITAPTAMAGNAFSDIEDIIADIAAGKMVIMVDDENRENEGDLLMAAAKVTRGQWDEGKVWDDEIGVSTSLSPKFPNISVPYASLLPVGIEGVLGAGRYVACDANSHSFLREIPQCWMSGQAAGVAAALAADANVTPRELDPRLIQQELLRQGVYLSPAVAAAAKQTTAAA